MRELSLHILDIAQNSIAASASLVGISIDEKPAEDLLRIIITDNGRGIPQSMLKQITDPFYTTKKTREVGLGLSLFAQAAQRAGGDLVVKSTVGVGTEVTATFIYHHLDRAPIGDIAGTLHGLILMNPEIDIIYQHTYEDSIFTLDTRDIKAELGGVPINHQAVTMWLRKFITQGLEDLYGGE